MRTLIFLLLFPGLIFSQSLPDSSLAKERKVRKLIILACYDSIPCDTQSVFVLDGTWKNTNKIPLQQTITDPRSFAKPDTNITKAAYDKKGRLIFIGPKSKPEHCFEDSALCRTFRYDNKNRLIAESDYTCVKGVNKIFYHYDNSGKLVLVTWEPRGDLLVTREEYSYTKEGKLDSVISWWAADPENPVRDSRDTKSCSIAYRYENGLITEAIVDDPARCHYALFTYWKDPENYIETSSHVVLRYVYVY